MFPGQYDASIDLGLGALPSPTVDAETYKELVLLYFALQKLLTSIEDGSLAGHFSSLVVDGTSDLVGVTTVEDNLILPKTSGKGILVDPAAPTFGWRDIIGQVVPKGVGAANPTWAVYRGSIYQYEFDSAATIEAWLTFHIPHDYVPGSDLYIHAHWSQAVVDTGGPAGVPGNAKWQFDISYATGHGTAGSTADPFNAVITTSVVQQASTTQYGHMIAEVQFTAAAGNASNIANSRIQVDGLLLVRVYRIKADAADTLNQVPFLHTCDVHYQSSNMATKNKAPNFYS